MYGFGVNQLVILSVGLSMRKRKGGWKRSPVALLAPVIREPLADFGGQIELIFLLFKHVQR